MDTNYGVEAQNKVLEYKYMPRGQSMTLSSLITFLLERFLPDCHHQYYVLENFKSSESYHTYNDFVPNCLRGRLSDVICMDRQTKGKKYDSSDIVPTEREGVFRIRVPTHTVESGRDTEYRKPSCTCKDWIRWHLSCKHFFAVIETQPSWQWKDLPHGYLSSPYLSADDNAIQNYFSEDQAEIAVTDPAVSENTQPEMETSDEIPIRMVSTFSH